MVASRSKLSRAARQTRKLPDEEVLQNQTRLGEEMNLLLQRAIGKSFDGLSNLQCLSLRIGVDSKQITG